MAGSLQADAQFVQPGVASVQWTADDVRVFQARVAGERSLVGDRELCPDRRSFLGRGYAQSQHAPLDGAVGIVLVAWSDVPRLRHPVFGRVGDLHERAGVGQYLLGTGPVNPVDADAVA